MNAIPPDFGLPAGALPHSPYAPSLARRWAALCEAAQAIAALLPASAHLGRVEDLAFPVGLDRVSGWRKVMIEQGLSDLSAMMEPGLVALLEVHAKGGDPSAAALALWQEFAAARSALISLAPPGDADDSGASNAA